MSVPALTLGLVSALEAAKSEISSYDWQQLRQMREAACKDATSELFGDDPLSSFAFNMLFIAHKGLVN